MRGKSLKMYEEICLRHLSIAAMQCGLDDAERLLRLTEERQVHRLTERAAAFHDIRWMMLHAYRGDTDRAIALVPAVNARVPQTPAVLLFLPLPLYAFETVRLLCRECAPS